MADEWFRFWVVSSWQIDRHYGAVPLVHFPTQTTILRAHVSFYIESPDMRMLAEPCTAGVWASVQDASLPPEDPPDIGTIPLQSSEDWLEWETFHARQLAEHPAEVQRVIWPSTGSRFWDIKANRRPLDNNDIRLWLVWSLPSDQVTVTRAVVAWSVLHRDRPSP